MKNALFLALILPACGDKDADDTAPSEEADADTDADTDTDTDTDTDADAQTTAVVTTISSDRSTGSFATVGLDGWDIADELFLSSGDPGVDADEGMVFQLNRFNYDNIRRYEPGAWGEPLWEQDMGDLANPYDVDLCNGDLFVTLYGRDFLGVYDPANGTLKGTVDLSEFNDGDESGPEPSALVEAGGKLYVSMNRLNRSKGWSDAGGMVAEVDCAAMAVTDSWPVGGNTTLYAWPGTDKLLAGAGAFGEDLAGLYVIDPAADTVTLLAETPGESIAGLVAAGNQAVAIALASDYSSYNLYCIDLAAGSIDLIEQTSRYLSGVAGNDRGEAWITASPSWIDEGAPTGIFIYDIATCTEKTTSPLAFSLYPNSIAFY